MKIQIIVEDQAEGIYLMESVMTVLPNASPRPWLAQIADKKYWLVIELNDFTRITSEQANFLSLLKTIERRTQSR